MAYKATLSIDHRGIQGEKELALFGSYGNEASLVADIAPKLGTAGEEIVKRAVGIRPTLTLSHFSLAYNSDFGEPTIVGEMRIVFDMTAHNEMSQMVATLVVEEVE